MPDPNYAAQPAPYPVRRRSLSGPIILTVIGVVFLLANLHVVSWAQLGFYFGRYWPVLLILVGIIRILEHFQAQRTGVRTVGLGFGGVVLLLLIACAGLAVGGAQKVNWQTFEDESGFDDSWMNGIFGQAYTYTEQLTHDLPAGTSLRVISDRGAVTVNSWNEPGIKVMVNKRVRASSQSDANKANEGTHPQFSFEGNVLTLNANAGGRSGFSAESNLEIYLPAQAAVDIATRHGDVAVRGRQGKVDISDSHGDVAIDDIKGDVALSVRSGDIKAAKVTGSITVEGRVSDVNISDVTGAVRINGEVFDNISLAKIAGPVTFKSARTDLEFARLDGELNVQSGDLTAKSIAGPVRLSTRSKDIHLQDVSGDLTLENRNGTIEVHAGGMPLGTISISNRKGDIQVTLPAKAGFQLQARTRRGDITSEFSDLAVSNSHGESSAAGTVGNGAAKLDINNEYGNVEIKKSIG
jgi:DUF4097 and DUF4098 domain-containing protein YvlB